MENQKDYIAFFDLDRTILTANSGAVLVRQAYKEGILNVRSLISAIYQSYLYKFNLRKTDQIISKMGSWVKGFTADSLNNLSDLIVNDILIDTIRPEIYNEINFHKERHAEVVLLSSAISPICNPIGEHLKMDHIICTTMEVINGVLTGQPIGNFCFGEEKGLQIKAYCKSKNISLNDAFSYGDSISDLPALELVGNPVCVFPDKKLARIAREKGWRILT